MSNDSSGLTKVLVVAGGVYVAGLFGAAWLMRNTPDAAVANAGDEASMSQRGMLVTTPDTEGPTPEQSAAKAEQAKTAALSGFSWEWRREVGAPIDYATGHMVSVRDRGAISRLVTFAGHDPLTRSAQWRSSRTTVARIPWDTAPSNYDWTGGTPSPKDSKQPPDPGAVDRLLFGVATGAQDVLSFGLSNVSDDNLPAPVAEANRRTILGGLLPGWAGALLR